MYNGRGGAVKDHRCCTLRQTRRGGALSLPGFSGGDGCCNRICRGEPACSPVDGSREAACPGGHIGPPLRDGGGVREPTGIGVKTDLANGAGRSPPPTGGPGRQAAGMSRERRGVVTPPYGSATGGVQRRADVWASAPTKGEQAASTTRASGAQRSGCGAGAREWVGIAAEIIPKGASNAGQSLSQPAADSSLCTREPCPAGDGGSGRRT